MQGDISIPEVEEFIRTHDHLYNGRLSSFYNFSRVVSLAWLNRALIALNEQHQDHVGVISGTPLEPELSIMRPGRVSITSYAMNKSHDLDLDWSATPPLNCSFVMCNQILEHVFNPHLGFKNLVHFTRPGGLIFVGVPVINCVHEEPHFFSAGYHPRFLAGLGKHNGLETVGISAWGSAKYLVHAVSNQWLTYQTLQAGSVTDSDRRFPNFIPTNGLDPNCPIAQEMGYKDVMTDCWGLFRKPK